MMKRALAVFLCLGIAFLPAMSNAGAGTKIPGFYKDLFCPLFPSPKLPTRNGKAQPELELTVAPKSKPKSASALTASPASSSSATLPVAMHGQFREYHIGEGISNITFEPEQNGHHTERAAGDSKLEFLQYQRQRHGPVQPAKLELGCLNRIFDQNPTQIFGKITAPGQIYLINQNGILFGRGSQVDVHTLIASSLNIPDSDFMNGALNFTAQDYQGTGNTNYLNASVINQGTITTDTLGSVFLLGPMSQMMGPFRRQPVRSAWRRGTDISLSPDTVSVRNSDSAGRRRHGRPRETAMRSITAK